LSDTWISILSASRARAYFSTAGFSTAGHGIRIKDASLAGMDDVT